MASAIGHTDPILGAHIYKLFILQKIYYTSTAASNTLGNGTMPHDAVDAVAKMPLGTFRSLHKNTWFVAELRCAHLRNARGSRNAPDGWRRVDVMIGRMSQSMFARIPPVWKQTLMIRPAEPLPTCYGSKTAEVKAATLKHTVAPEATATTRQRLAVCFYFPLFIWVSRYPFSTSPFLNVSMCFHQNTEPNRTPTLDDTHAHNRARTTRTRNTTSGFVNNMVPTCDLSDRTPTLDDTHAHSRARTTRTRTRNADFQVYQQHGPNLRSI